MGEYATFAVDIFADYFFVACRVCHYGWQDIGRRQSKSIYSLDYVANRDYPLLHDVTLCCHVCGNREFVANVGDLPQSILSRPEQAISCGVNSSAANDSLANNDKAAHSHEQHRNSVALSEFLNSDSVHGKKG